MTGPALGRRLVVNAVVGGVLGLAVAVAAGSTASFTASGRVAGLDRSGRPRTPADLVPDTGAVRWRPPAGTGGCTALREAGGEIGAPWPPCAGSPAAPGRACPDVAVPPRTDVGAPRRLDTRAVLGPVEVTLVAVSPDPPCSLAAAPPGAGTSA